MVRLLALILALGLTAPAAAQTATPAAGATLAERLEAARTAARVQSALARDEVLARFVLTAAQRDGVILLAGTVATAAQRARAEEVARSVGGVRSLDNAIRVDAQAGRRTGPIPPPLRAAQPELRPADPPDVEAMEPAPPAAPRAGTAPAPDQQPTHYVVQSGDTLGAIARRHGVSVQQIQRLNNLRGTTIRPGQRLRLR